MDHITIPSKAIMMNNTLYLTDTTTTNYHNHHHQLPITELIQKQSLSPNHHLRLRVDSATHLTHDSSSHDLPSSTSSSNHNIIIPGAVIHDDLSSLSAHTTPLLYLYNNPCTNSNAQQAQCNPINESDPPTTLQPFTNQIQQQQQQPLSPNAQVIAKLESLEHLIDLSSLAAPPHLTDFDEHRRLFKQTVNAVCEIVTEKLYKWRGMSLEDYFRSRFSISRAQVYRVVDSAGILRDLQDLELTWDYASAVGNAEPGAKEMPLPVKQRVCAAIKAVTPNKLFRQELWKALCHRCPPYMISSKDVKETWTLLISVGAIDLDSNHVCQDKVRDLATSADKIRDENGLKQARTTKPSQLPSNTAVCRSPVVDTIISTPTPSPPPLPSPKKSGSVRIRRRVPASQSIDMHSPPTTSSPIDECSTPVSKRPRLRRAASSSNSSIPQPVLGRQTPPKRYKRARPKSESTNKSEATVKPSTRPLIMEFSSCSTTPAQSPKMTIVAGPSPYVRNGRPRQPRYSDLRMYGVLSSDQYPGINDQESSALPVHITGGTVNAMQAKLINVAIQSLQQLMDSGIYLEPMVASTWIPGVTQYRFRKDTMDQIQGVLAQPQMLHKYQSDIISDPSVLNSGTERHTTQAMNQDLDGLNHGVLASKLLDLANCRMPSSSTSLATGRPSSNTVAVDTDLLGDCFVAPQVANSQVPVLSCGVEELFHHESMPIQGPTSPAIMATPPINSSATYDFSNYTLTPNNDLMDLLVAASMNFGVSTPPNGPNTGLNGTSVFQPTILPNDIMLGIDSTSGQSKTGLCGNDFDYQSLYTPIANTTTTTRTPELVHHQYSFHTSDNPPTQQKCKDDPMDGFEFLTYPPSSSPPGVCCSVCPPDSSDQVGAC